MCQACFTQNINLKAKRNLKELLLFGYTRKYNNNIPIEIILICKQYFGPLINSKILKTNEKILLLNYLENQIGNNNVYDWNWKLIFRATEHGFKLQDFYKHCENMSNTVVLVYNKPEDQVFGGYTPCILWRLNDWTREKMLNGGSVGSPIRYGKDDSLTTCLFSLRTKSEIGPQLFTLKKDKCDKAMEYCHVSLEVAFCFGNEDFSWMNPGFVITVSDLMQPGANRRASFFQCNDMEKESSFGSQGLYKCCIEPNEIEIFQLK